ncbi:MAG: hypothetical protein GF411_18010 [Candidatus Lokiarchaeota archaeon]|nr:hypothetical protein [Candidatus Lokiarchaeota archaeon]
MIRSDLALNPIINADMQENGREVDIYNDPKVVRLVALNLELAVKNLMASHNPPECLVLTAEICTHRLFAMPTKNGDVKVIVFEL